MLELGGFVSALLEFLALEREPYATSTLIVCIYALMYRVRSLVFIRTCFGLEYFCSRLELQSVLFRVTEALVCSSCFYTCQVWGERQRCRGLICWSQREKWTGNYCAETRNLSSVFLIFAQAKRLWRFSFNTDSLNNSRSLCPFLRCVQLLPIICIMKRENFHEDFKWKLRFVSLSEKPEVSNQVNASEASI